MLLLGIDLGTSFIKVCVTDLETKQRIAWASCPDEEAGILSLHTGWAEQSPETWWLHVKNAIKKMNAEFSFDPRQIAAIGIAYQMHGLVLVDKQKQVLRNSVIWCDSRAVELGNAAFAAIGKERCSSCLLNSPGNFTAAKLAWVKQNEPEIYGKIDKIMLPGDFISMKLTGEVTTTPSALSEGVFWDFSNDKISADVLDYFGFEANMIPGIRPVFSLHGNLQKETAGELSLKPGIPVSYKAGDQMNNALSLNVVEPGEVAATAGTSGVIYAVTEKLLADKYSRVNVFAHVNHTSLQKRLGVLLCINGTGIMNRWVKELAGENYERMNVLASQIDPGSNGLLVLPFGNGAERMFENQTVGAQVLGIDLNKHSKSHLFRAVQEGIAFSFRYGLDIMKENNIHPSVIRVGNANMFLSELFTEIFANTTKLPVELYQNDGSTGAALGAGIGANIYSSVKEAFSDLRMLKRIEPGWLAEKYDGLYPQWKAELMKWLGKED